MAAGLTDHVWTFRELLTVKFEPIHKIKVVVDEYRNGRKGQKLAPLLEGVFQHETF
jgi:hypothetical protein